MMSEPNHVRCDWFLSYSRPRLSVAVISARNTPYRVTTVPIMTQVQMPCHYRHHIRVHFLSPSENVAISKLCGLEFISSGEKTI